MFTGCNKEYCICKHYQTELRRQADQYRLAHEARDDDRWTSGGHPWALRAVLIALAVLALFAAYRQVHAQEAHDPGEYEPFPEAMLAYRLGNYYFVTGDYARAADKLSEAVRLMPETAFALQPRYSVLYWALGEAQEAEGMQAEALISYRRFLTLADEEAALWTQEKVRLLVMAQARETAWEVRIR